MTERAPSAEEVLASAPTPIFVTDVDGRVLLANAAGEGFANASEGAMRGRPFEAFVRLGTPLAELHRRADGAPVTIFDSDVQLPDGRRRAVDLSLSPMPGRGDCRLISVYARPSARHSARPGQAPSSGRRSVDAAAILAHEIKNPLSGIRGAAQLIEGAGEGGEMPRLIREEVDRIAGLLDRMETLTDTRPLALGPLNIHAVLHDVVSLARQGFARGQRLDEVYDPSLPDVVGDRDTLVQLFLNLLKNAVEAVEDTSGTVRLTTAYRNGVSIPSATGRVALPIEICVIDDGPGIAPEVARGFFDPFVTTKPNGTGLGLPLADKLAGDMGGLLEHERDAVAGRTVFRVRLRRAGKGA